MSSCVELLLVAGAGMVWEGGWVTGCALYYNTCKQAAVEQVEHRLVIMGFEGIQ